MTFILFKPSISKRNAKYEAFSHFDFTLSLSLSLLCYWFAIMFINKLWISSVNSVTCNFLKQNYTSERDTRTKMKKRSIDLHRDLHNSRTIHTIITNSFKYFVEVRKSLRFLAHESIIEKRSLLIKINYIGIVAKNSIHHFIPKIQLRTNFSFDDWLQTGYTKNILLWNVLWYASSDNLSSIQNKNLSLITILLFCIDVKMCVYPFIRMEFVKSYRTWMKNQLSNNIIRIKKMILSL